MGNTVVTAFLVPFLELSGIRGGVTFHLRQRNSGFYDNVVLLAAVCSHPDKSPGDRSYWLLP